MGEVGLIYKLMPTGVEVDLQKIQDTIKGSLPEAAKLNLIEEKPIAFGLKALEVQIIMEDKTGGVEDVEKFLSGIDGVASVEVISQTLL